MPNIRPTIGPVSPTDNTGTGATGNTGMSGRFFGITLPFQGGAVYLANLQNARWKESSGMHYLGQMGNNFNEPIPGMMFVQGSFSRLVPRGQSLKQLYAKYYLGNNSTLSVVDWRELPLNWIAQFNYQSASGNTTFYTETEMFYDLYVQDYEISHPDQYDVRREDGTFMAQFSVVAAPSVAGGANVGFDPSTYGPL